MRLIAAFSLCFYFSSIWSQSVEVISPNGGEVVEGCTELEITWESTGTSGFFNVDYSTNGGAVWTSLASLITTESFVWEEVPNIYTESALIKVYDAQEPEIQDVSDGTFTITAPVQLVTPNGGEYWNAWDTEEVVYMKAPYVSAVALDYSLDGGESWTLIANNQTSGAYDWFIPNLPSAEALIRVRDQNVSCRVDESDALFSIVSEVEVEVPNGGEEYQAIVSPFTSTGIYLMDDGTMVTDGGRFFDNGGESGNYSSINYTKYFWPSTASNELRMTFTRFHTYDGCDVVNIYDATTNQLKLSMAGNLTPELHTSPRVAQGRGLKVVFTQSTHWQCGGGNSVSSGWDANIESIEVDYDNAPHPITWDITGTSKEFDLDYSVNGGLTWKRIVSNYYTLTGEYDWPVPDEASEEALVRVTDSENGEVVDVSDAVFTILEAVPTVKLLYPNGGNSFYAGTSPVIQWETRFFDSPSVVLTYSLDGGLSWLDLASPLNTGEYEWLLPSTPSTEVLVKVSDPTDTTLSDASDAVFTILPHITVTSPNGGETLSGCGSQGIYWSAGGTSGVYVVELSLDGGSTWSTLVDNDTGGGWSWGEVPNIDNDSALIRVSDASDSTKSDVSDSVFTIEKTTDVVMVTPNGGEYWNAWDTEPIVYMRSSNANAVALDYSLDGGESWTLIANNQTSGTYDWFIPNLPSAEALIRVRDQNVSCRVDESDALFSIVSEVEVEVPNGGEEYQAIVSPFTSTGIYLMDDGTMVTDGGRFFDNGGESGNYSSINYTKYFWPSTASNELRMTFTRFHTYDGCDVVNIYDATTNQLKLSMAGNLTPELHTSPRVAQGRGLKVVFTQSTHWQCGGGNSVSSGWDANIESIEVDYDNAPHPITWDITGTSKEFDLDYSVNGGLTWKRIVSNYYTLTGEYDWPVPDEASEEALVRVTDSENGEVVDVSDAVFTILAGVSEITILQPNTADILYAGASYEVQWSSRFLGSQYVKMELSLDNGETWAEVEENVLNDGSFDWIVPDTYSTTCLLRLTDMGNDETYDVSDIIFTISPPIVMTTQNSLNSNYRSCTVANINWFAGGTSGAYDILLSLDDGQTWDFIEEGYQDAANFVSYSWYVPNEVTLSARVRVLDSNDSEKSDEGDEAFQISPTISLTTFNYGGLFTIGDQYQVLWQDTLTSGQYNLDYSIDEGNSWTSIVENYENLENTFNWLIPNNPSQEVTLRIEDATNECKSTQSTIPFTLTHFEPTIQVDYPNGFEQLIPSETITLQWSDPSSNQLYNIDYSTDAGATWVLIDANYVSADRSILWEVPDVASLQCLVRVRDAENSNHYDISDFAFEIQALPNDCGESPCQEIVNCNNYSEFDLSSVSSGVFPSSPTQLGFQEPTSFNLTVFINETELFENEDEVLVTVTNIESFNVPIGIEFEALSVESNGFGLECLVFSGTPAAFGSYDVSLVCSFDMSVNGIVESLVREFSHTIVIPTPDFLSFGCVYESSVNYNEGAQLDAGNCLFEGCTIPEACNYQIHANVDDGTCEFDCTLPPDSLCQGDLDSDGQVSISDLLIVLSVYGNVCE